MGRDAGSGYACALIVGLIHPFPSIHYWRNANRIVLRAAAPQLEANRELTDQKTRQWALEHPNDSITLLMRANYLTDMRQFAEALNHYGEALQQLPEERELIRGEIEKRMAETNKCRLLPLARQSLI